MKSLIDKYKNLSVRARAALWFTICSFLQKGISFITVPIFTRLLTTEEYGANAAYVWEQIKSLYDSKWNTYKSQARL